MVPESQAVGGAEEYYYRGAATPPHHKQYLSAKESPRPWYGAGAGSLGLEAKHRRAGSGKLRAGPPPGELP